MNKRKRTRNLTNDLEIERTKLLADKNDINAVQYNSSNNSNGQKYQFQHVEDSKILTVGIRQDEVRRFDDYKQISCEIFKYVVRNRVHMICAL